MAKNGKSSEEEGDTGEELENSKPRVYRGKAAQGVTMGKRTKRRRIEWQ